jgi:Carboxypeptidase regulatory-like domain
MKRAFAGFLVLIAASLAVAQIKLGGGPSPERKEKPITSRVLVGQVTDKNDQPIAEAIVYLKDAKTLAVKSYVSQKDGSYRFNALSVNNDYEVYAQKADKKSPVKKLSQFDSRAEPRINLKIDM